MRDGVAFEGGERKYGLERLFQQYGVDLYVSGPINDTQIHHTAQLCSTTMHRGG